MRHGSKALRARTDRRGKIYRVALSPFAPAAKERREFAPKGARLCEPEPTGAVKRYIVFYIPVCACGKKSGDGSLRLRAQGSCEPEPTGAAKIFRT